MRHRHHRHFPKDARHLSLLPPPPSGATPEVHWRHRRNIVIYLIHRQGVPQPLIADAFDLGIVQIRAIIRNIAEYDKSLINHGIPHVLAGAARRFVGENARGNTPLRRWRLRRDAMIRLAHRMGLTRELIADVFDLCPSRVLEIVKEAADGAALAEPTGAGTTEGRPGGAV
jgi:hypothetical protein